MGLDLTISEITKYDMDEKGRTTRLITELCNFHNTYEYSDKLNWAIECGLNNNSIVEFTGEMLYQQAENIENEQEKEYVLTGLKNAEILNSCEEFYQVELSY